MIVMGFCRHVIFSQETIEVFSINPEVPAGQPESWKLSGAYPAQHCRITNPAALGDKSYGYIFRDPLFRCSLQVSLLIELLRGPVLYRRVLPQHFQR